jgi:lysophospholipase L1-like esterase
VANPTFEDKTTLFDALIRRFAEETLERGVPLIAVLAYAPDSTDDDADEVSRAMKASLARAGVPTLDTRGVFASTSENMSNMYSRDGIHWSPRGHRHVAYAIADLLGQADLE